MAAGRQEKHGCLDERTEGEEGLSGRENWEEDYKGQKTTALLPGHL